MTINQFAERERRAQESQARTAQASLRLGEVAERHDSGRGHRVASFLASIFNGAVYPLDLFILRTGGVALADDALACIDALRRWGKANLHKLIQNGEQRIAAVIARWGLGRT